MSDMFSVPPVKWSESHGVVGSHQSVGALYFSLVYMLKAKRCVVLGSGGGFVPLMMLAAQRRLLQEGLIDRLDVTLVDANTGIWGLPVYEAAAEIDPDLKLVKRLTRDAAELFDDIDYLHVDADHSYAGVMADLDAYFPRLSAAWAITVHDTFNPDAIEARLPLGAWRAAERFSRRKRLAIVNFAIGCGTALIMPRAGDPGGPLTFPARVRAAACRGVARIRNGLRRLRRRFAPAARTEP